MFSHIILSQKSFEKSKPVSQICNKTDSSPISSCLFLILVNSETMVGLGLSNSKETSCSLFKKLFFIFLYKN